MAPEAYVELARSAGWEVVSSRIVTPPRDLEDGRWEVMQAREMVKGMASMDEVVDRADGGGDARGSSKGTTSETLRAHADAMEAAMPPGGMSEVAAMDVWTAVLRPAAV